MKKLLALIILSTAPLFALNENVQKDSASSNITGNLTFGTGKTLTVASGGTLTVAAGATFTFPSASINWSSITGTPTTLAGYGITDPIVFTSGSYADPAWITSLAASKLTGTIVAGRLPAFTGGDVTSSAGTLVLTLNSVVTAGSVGSTTAIPVITYDAKGRITSTTTATIVAPWGGVTGTPTSAVGYGIVNGSNIDAWGAKSLPTGAVVGTTDTQSLTNKKLGSLTSNGFVKTSAGDGTLSVDTSTYLTGNQTVTLSGDVSGSGATAITTAIGSNKVTNAMLAQMAAHTFKGNNTGSTANALDLSIAQMQSELSVAAAANPSGTVGLSTVNGSASTYLRSDAAPPLSQAITPTWTGLHTFNPSTTPSNVILFDQAQPGSAGQRDSHFLIMRGTSFDTSGHNADWKSFVDVTSNAGASTWRLQSRVDSGTSTDRVTVSDAGDLAAAGAITATGAVSGSNLSLGGTLTTGAALTTTPGNAITITTTGPTSVTFPTSGTLATTAGSVTSLAGTANEITASASTGAITLSLPSALTFTGKTVTGGTFASPALTTPTLGVATATSVNKVAITAPTSSATLTIADGKTATISNTLTLSGTDSSSVAFGGGGTVIYASNKLSSLASTSSAELAGVISDETGSGSLAFGTSPTFTTPRIANQGSGSFNWIETVNDTLSADRTLTWVPGNSSRTITLNGNPTLGTNNTSPTGSPTFVGATFSGAVSGITTLGATGTTTLGDGTNDTHIFLNGRDAANGGSYVSFQKAGTQFALIGKGSLWRGGGSTSGNLAVAAESGAGVDIFTNGSGTPTAALSSTGLAVTGVSTSTGKMKAGSGYADVGIYNGGFDITINGIDLTSNDDASGAQFAAFRNSSNVIVGGVSRVTTTNAVTFNTTSDRRLKTNIRDYADSARIIDGLRPRVFDWVDSREDSKNAIGFVAQEENAIDPLFARIGAVTVGDGDPVTIKKQWQRSDTALIPIVVAELKSLRARAKNAEDKNAALEKRLVALETLAQKIKP